MLPTSLSLDGSVIFFFFLLYCLYLPLSLPVGSPLFKPLIFFEVCTTFSPVPCSLHTSSTSHPLLSLFTSFFFSAPLLSSHPSRFSFFLFLCSYHLSDCLLMPSFLLLLSSCPPPGSHPAHRNAVYPCITGTALPAPAVKLFLSEHTCEPRSLMKIKEESAGGVMESKSCLL